MKKRCQRILKSREAEILLQLRLLKNLSVRKVAEKIKKSHTLVNHIELGRAEISDEYIENFLSCLHITKEEWDSLLKKDRKSTRVPREIIAEDCAKKIRSLSLEKLERLQSFLSLL